MPTSSDSKTVFAGAAFGISHVQFSSLNLNKLTSRDNCTHKISSLERQLLWRKLNIVKQRVKMNVCRGKWNEVWNKYLPRWRFKTDKPRRSNRRLQVRFSGPLIEISFRSLVVYLGTLEQTDERLGAFVGSVKMSKFQCFKKTFNSQSESQVTKRK